VERFFYLVDAKVKISSYPHLSTRIQHAENEC